MALRTREQIVANLKSTPFEQDRYGNVVVPPSPASVVTIDNEFVDYDARGYVYCTPDGEHTSYPTSFLKGSKQFSTRYAFEDADLAGYREEDRAYDRWNEVEPDVTSCGWGNDPRSEKSLFAGFTVVKTDGFVSVRCSYCDGLVTYSEFAAACPQSATESETQRAYAAEMLWHYEVCKAEFQVPLIVRWDGGGSSEAMRARGYCAPVTRKTWRPEPSLDRAEFVPVDDPALVVLG